MGNIDWNDIIACSISEDGSGGVVFFETTEGAFCMKGSPETSADYLGYFIYKHLGLDIA